MRLLCMYRVVAKRERSQIEPEPPALHVVTSAVLPGLTRLGTYDWSGPQYTSGLREVITWGSPCSLVPQAPVPAPPGGF
jgi:hypothetical protein